MLTRALIVFLVLLNVSVALWWMLRGDPAVPEHDVPAGVAQLQLQDPAETPATPAQVAVADSAPLQDADAAKVAASPLPSPAEAVTATVVAAPAVEPSPAPAEAARPAAPALRCVALGPFADQAAAQAAQGRLGASLGQVQLREQTTAGATSRFRVMLPPAASREAAQATVQRIVAAGLSDYYIIAQGPDANAIALGQYRNREGAERRLAALSAAGFKAELSGGEASSAWWLQGTLADGQTATAARQRSGAAQQRSLDCPGLR